MNAIDSLAKITDWNDNKGGQLQMLVNQLKEKIRLYEQNQTNSMSVMKTVHDSPINDLMIDNNEEIKKLRLENEKLKNDLNFEVTKYSDAITSAKDESKRLRELLKQKNDEINQLTYKMIDAQTYISLLEKEKHSMNEPVHSSMMAIKDHFKIIKKALLANKSMYQMIQSKNFLKESNDLNDFNQ